MGRFTSFLILGTLSLATASGCSGINRYTRFYHDYTNGADVEKDPNYIVTDEDAHVYAPRGSQEEDFARNYEAGYVLLGVSSFSSASGDWSFGGGATDEQEIRDQANIVLAHHATLFVDRIASMQHVSEGLDNHYAVQVQLNQMSLERALGYVNQVAPKSDSAGKPAAMKTTVMETERIVEPYEFTVYYWIRAAPGPILGIATKALSREQRTALQTNKGVVIRGVRRGTPAFEADLLVGDVVKTLAGRDVSDPETFERLLERHAGQKVRLELLRDGKALWKEIALNPQR